MIQSAAEPSTQPTEASTADARPTLRRLPSLRRWLIVGALGVLLAIQASVPAVFDPDAALTGSAEAAGLADPPSPIHVASAERLASLFDRLGYRLEAVVGEAAAAVPAVGLVALPWDLSDVAPVDRRKHLFIRAVLPIVLHANAVVLDERARLLANLDRLKAASALAADEREWLVELAERHGLSEIAVDAESLGEVLDRVDAVPVSLAIAQAILESGWGTSRFAQTGNALFGQWTWDDASGIVPAARAAGRNHSVRAFDSLADSARAYLFNLNTHPAYAGFREARAAVRARSGELPSGSALAGRLTPYSERGGAYVEEIRTVIRQNRLQTLDDATLDDATLDDATLDGVRVADVESLSAEGFDG